jgi:hypothetical protein
MAALLWIAACGLLLCSSFSGDEPHRLTAAIAGEFVWFLPSLLYVHLIHGVAYTAP